MTSAQHARWLEGQVLAISISKTTRLVYRASFYTVETQTIRGGHLVWKRLFGGHIREEMIKLMEDYVR